MTTTCPTPDDPLCAGLFGLQHEQTRATRKPVETPTASSFAKLFAASEGGDGTGPSAPKGPDQRFA